MSEVEDAVKPDILPKSAAKKVAKKPTTKKTTRKPKATKKSSAFFLAYTTTTGEEYISLNSSLITPNIQLMNGVMQILSQSLGHYAVREYNHTYSVAFLSNHLTDLREDLINYDIDPDAAEYKGLFAILDRHTAAIREQMKEKMTRGLLEFQDIPYAWDQGTPVVTVVDEEKIAGRLESVTPVQSFWGNYHDVKIKVIHNVRGTLQEGLYLLRIREFRGLVKIDDLPLRPLLDDERASLIERGRKFVKYATGVNYIHYTGQLVRSSYWGSTSYRATGRVMADVGTFEQVDNNQFGLESRMSGIQEDHDRQHGDHSSSKKMHMEVDEDDYWRTYPFLYGFSFKAKQWGRMSVSGLRDIAWRSDSFDKLVLPDEEKELVRAIVEHQGTGFTDIVEDKGGGSIFLLHGPPGQGKTLTAETIAEILQRPLYSISVGELGINPNELEDTLREILDVATIWNAVLLLDEADIFLEARDEHDIVRNAMVGVFLRLLEYHQGVLFLTTNRVKNIDQAFYSRISIALAFDEADDEKRRKIWSNLLDAAGLSEISADDLKHHDINGRQIKNAIRIAQTLAIARKTTVSVESLSKVIEMTTKFKEDQASFSKTDGKAKLKVLSK